MILIADSGATKTDWCAGTTKTDSRTIQTEGINPFHQSPEEIERIISSALLPRLESGNEVTDIYFYGAGCTPDKAVAVKNALQRSFTKAHIEVESDLLGAARALCGHTPGLACILGTGANSCAYDGQKITANVSPLGYILGDEGSGAALGKRLAGDCLKHLLPQDLCQDFLKHCGITPAQLLDRVYRQPLANRFLASLTPFLSAHRERTEIHALLTDCFADFFRRNVRQYDWQHNVAHFTGSVAYYFRPEVEEAAHSLGITTERFIQSPMEGLIAYHLEA